MLKFGQNFETEVRLVGFGRILKIELVIDVEVIEDIKVALVKALNPGVPFVFGNVVDVLFLGNPSLNVWEYC